MLAYRSLPEVCRFLNHDVMDRAGVERRIRERLPDGQVAGDVTCGVAVEVDGHMVGDAMLRAPDRQRELWIGFGFHPSVWGRGLATAVATELVHVGAEIGLQVWADAFPGNVASQRALLSAGLVEQDMTGERVVFAGAPVA